MAASIAELSGQKTLHWPAPPAPPAGPTLTPHAASTAVEDVDAVVAKALLYFTSWSWRSKMTSIVEVSRGGRCCSKLYHMSFFVLSLHNRSCSQNAENWPTILDSNCPRFKMD